MIPSWKDQEARLTETLAPLITCGTHGPDEYVIQWLVCTTSPSGQPNHVWMTRAQAREWYFQSEVAKRNRGQQ